MNYEVSSSRKPVTHTNNVTYNRDKVHTRNFCFFFNKHFQKSFTFFHSTIAWYKQKRLFIMHLFWCCYCIWIISNHYTLLSLKNNMNNIAFSCNSSGIHKSVKFFFWDEMLLVASLRNLKEKGNMDFVQTLCSTISSHIPSGVSVYSFKREM